jgi:hypothetical protein
VNPDQNPQLDEQGNPVQLDENGNPIQLDENGNPIPAGQGSPGMPPEQGGIQQMPGADGQQVPVDGQPAPAQSYYNDPETDPDGDEDYVDPTGQQTMQKGIAMMDENFVTDDQALSALIKASVVEAVQAINAPVIAKMNELLKAQTGNDQELKTLKALVTEQVDLVKGWTPTTPVEASTPTAKPADAEVSGDVAKALPASETLTIDPGAVQGGSEPIAAKAPGLIAKARAIRDDINKSFDGTTTKADLVKALGDVMSNPTEANVTRLETVLKGVA